MKAVEIDFPAKTATITMEPGQSVERESVEKALQGAGYGVRSFGELEAQPRSP